MLRIVSPRRARRFVLAASSLRLATPSVAGGVPRRAWVRGKVRVRHSRTSARLPDSLRPLSLPVPSRFLRPAFAWRSAVRASTRLAQIVLIGTATVVCVLIATGPLLSDDSPADPAPQRVRAEPAG